MQQSIEIPEFVIPKFSSEVKKYLIVDNTKDFCAAIKEYSKNGKTFDRYRLLNLRPF